MATVASNSMTEATDEQVLRRTQSTGDIQVVARPRRTHTSSRSEGRATRTTSRLDGTSAHHSRTSVSHIASAEEGRLLAQSPFSIADLRQTAVDERDATGRLAAVPAAQTPQTQVTQSSSWLIRLFRFLGYGGPNARERREFVSLIWNLSLVLVQFVVIIALLTYSAHHESPTMPGQSEWGACDRPLGIWDSLWLVRAGLSGILSVWTYKKNRATRALAAARGNDPEGNVQTNVPAQPDMNRRPLAGRAPPPRDQRAAVGSANNLQTHETDILANMGTVWQRQVLYDRLQILLTFASFGWFLTAHVLEYTSVNTCRLAAPHLWWLTFGILCLLYLILLEIFLMGLVFFIIGPFIYLLYNIVLLCLGRHPLQNPHYIKPSVDKIPKSVVDQIPLVLYIPAPPEGASDDKAPTEPQPVHMYPPRLQKPTSSRRRRFVFLRKKSKKVDGVSMGKEGTAKKTPKKPEEMTWEDNWELGDYPFVRLEENRASCAICLLDFEEPKKAPWAIDADAEKEETGREGESVIQPTTTGGNEDNERPADRGEPAVLEIQVEDATGEEQLRLSDAGEGPQPLRLLSCGHVFHKTCLDPWLTDVSGRCPVCQQPVEIPQPTGKDKRQRRTS
ncbi:hypothetical protein OBBRIDRAFT_884250 [Obba rivulosa]|uniref:RING-type E3 ubiquitin transferase n=1 Tax=Obba rivulosa TaxID=1052685 RepID=A0A8E2DSU6_9APHY|nr:hypothetical protein OBBRIDRAFT_884250 [Obba rivulosa]